MSHQLKDRTNQDHEFSELDVRVKLIKTIWACATGMLGISIPLVGISNSTLIPFTVIVGATVSTAAIWLGKGVQSQSNSPKITLEQLNELEERLANIEAISLLERRLAERDVTQRPVEVRPATQQTLEVPRY